MPPKAKRQRKPKTDLTPYMEQAAVMVPHVPSVLDSLGISDDLLDKLIAQQQELNDTEGLKSTKKDGSYRTDTTKTLAKIGLDLNKDGKVVKDEIVTIRVADDLEALMYGLFMAGVLLNNTPVKFNKDGRPKINGKVYDLVANAVKEKYPNVDEFLNDDLFVDLINWTMMPKTKTFTNKRLNMKKKIAKQLAEVSKGFTFTPPSADQTTMLDIDDTDQQYEQRMMSKYDRQ